MPRPKLARVSTTDLRREIERRAVYASTLEVKRVEIARELEQLDAEITALGGSAPSPTNGAKNRRGRTAPRRGRRTNASITRAANKVPLHTALHDVLTGKTMGVSEVAQAVQDAGYKTNSGHFRTMVNITLLKRKDLFKKRGRGQYTAK